MAFNAEDNKVSPDILSACAGLSTPAAPNLADVLHELNCLKTYIEHMNEQHQRALGELTQKVNELRQEIRFERGETDSEQCALPNFPLHTHQELRRLEENLDGNDTFIQQVKTVIRRVGGEDIVSFVRAAMKKLIADELATNYTWRGTQEKPSMQDLKVTALIREVCHQLFPNAHDKMMNAVMQRHIVHAKERLQKRWKTAKNPLEVIIP